MLDVEKKWMWVRGWERERQTESCRTYTHIDAVM